MSDNVIQMNRLPVGVTACTKCDNFLNLEPNSVRRDVWYNHLCKASPLLTDIDPYDGKKKPYMINAMDDKCFIDDQQYKHCRDVNYGRCGKYSGSIKPNPTPGI